MIQGEHDVSFWRDRRVFVTGGFGFLGSWLVERLIEEGSDVFCLMRDGHPESRLWDGDRDRHFVVVKGDARDQFVMERALGDHEVDTVFHLAAQTQVTVANSNPVSTFDSNVRGTWAVLEACRRSPKVKAVVVASSDKAYGAQEKLPYVESARLAGRHPYDCSKSCVDLIAQCYAKTYGLRIGITRCGNFFGGGDLNWSRLVPGTIRYLIRAERPLIRSNGKATRDYLYVEDGADAYLTLAEAMHGVIGMEAAAFNFSYGEPRSALEMVDSISSAMMIYVTPIVKDEARNEIADQWLDSTKAKELLGWKPKVGFREGIKRTVAWYRGWFQKRECA